MDVEVYKLLSKFLNVATASLIAFFTVEMGVSVASLLKNQREDLKND